MCVARLRALFVLGLTRSHLILEQQLATPGEFFKATPGLVLSVARQGGGGSGL